MKKNFKNHYYSYIIINNNIMYIKHHMNHLPNSNHCKLLDSGKYIFFSLVPIGKYYYY